MCQSDPVDRHVYQPGGLHDALEFLKRTRSALSQLRRVRVWKDRFAVYDVNGDRFQIDGLGYASADVIPVLNAVWAAYNPSTIHEEPKEGTFKEFKTGRRYPWAADRVM